jgi:hypothetical protein
MKILPKLLGVLTAFLLLTLLYNWSAEGQFTVRWEQLEGANDGTVALPAISFRADTDTGIYRSGDNELVVVTRGARRALYDSIGGITYGTSMGGPTQGHDLASSDALVVPVDWWWDAAHRRVHTRSHGPAEIGAPGGNHFRRASGTYPNGTPGAVTTNDVLGIVRFEGYAGLNAGGFVGPIAEFWGRADEVPTAVSRGGSIFLGTTPTASTGYGSSSETRPWLHVSSDGNVYLYSQTVNEADSREVIVWGLDATTDFNVGRDDLIESVDFLEIARFVGDNGVNGVWIDEEEGNLFVGGPRESINSTKALIFIDKSTPNTSPDAVSALWGTPGLDAESAVHIRTEGDHVYRIGGRGMIALGGLDATFPALKRNGNVLQARLADDSGWAQFEAVTFRASGLNGVTAAPFSCAGTANLTITGGIITTATCT